MKYPVRMSILAAGALWAVIACTGGYGVNTESPGSFSVMIERLLNRRHNPLDNLGTTGDSRPRNWYGLRAADLPPSPPMTGQELLWNSVYADVPPRTPEPRIVDMK